AFAARAGQLRCALVADGIRAVECPVRPGRGAPEDARLPRLVACETQVRLEPRQRIGRHRRTLLDRDAQLVGPVDVVERGGDEAELLGALGVEQLADRRARRLEGLALLVEAALE